MLIELVAFRCIGGVPFCGRARSGVAEKALGCRASPPGFRLGSPDTRPPVFIESAGGASLLPPVLPKGGGGEGVD